MAGLAAKFGSGAMTNSVAEIAAADTMFVIGSNTTENHPIIALRMKEAVRNGAQLIVADPRRIPLVDFATLWLRHKPGTDSVLLNGIMHAILKEGLEDKEFIAARTEGFEEFGVALNEFTPEFTANITGVAVEDIIRAAHIYATAQSAGIYYAMGITQHVFGTNNVHAVANLAMLTGNLGKPSAGVNPLRGQNNVQGCCDMGCLPDVYPGYQKVIDPVVRHRFEQAWGVNTLSARPGTPASEMAGAILAGNLKGMYIFGENPAVSDPNSNHAVKGFKGLEFLVVQDIFMNETAELADVVLPSASFAEKSGTFTSSERRVQRVRPAVDAPGRARDDLSIFQDIYERLSGRTITERAPEAVFRELASLWPAMSGMSYERLGREGLQWPCPTDDHPGTPYLFKDSFTRNEEGRALFTKVPYVLSNELPDAEYPFILTTGRQLFHYHTGTMTRRSKGIDAVAPEAFVELNPEDAARLGVADRQHLRVSSRRGAIELKARVSEIVPPRVVFIPFHYAEAAANKLTTDARDPMSKIMEAKVCAVAIEPLEE